MRKYCTCMWSRLSQTSERIPTVLWFSLLSLKSVFLHKRPGPCSHSIPCRSCCEHIRWKRLPIHTDTTNGEHPRRPDVWHWPWTAFLLGMLPTPWTLVLYLRSHFQHLRLKNILEQLCSSRCFVGGNPWSALSAGLLFCKVWNVKIRVFPDHYLLRNLKSEMMESVSKFIPEQVHAVLTVRAL